MFQDLNGSLMCTIQNESRPLLPTKPQGEGMAKPRSLPEKATLPLPGASIHPDGEQQAAQIGDDDRIQGERTESTFPWRVPTGRRKVPFALVPIKGMSRSELADYKRERYLAAKQKQKAALSDPGITARIAAINAMEASPKRFQVPDRDVYPA